jgi:hypothetical protein
MELLSVAELALRVKLSPSRILEKARRGEIHESNWEGAPKPQSGATWKQCLRHCNGTMSRGWASNHGTIAAA